MFIAKRAFGIRPVLFGFLRVIDQGSSISIRD